MLYVADTPGKGRGVYTDAPIAKDAVVEECPVIIIPQDEMRLMTSTVVYEYTYDWEEHGGAECFVCGYGMLYNHSSDPNIEWDTDLERRMVVFTAVRDIAAGEELCHDYWFDQEVTFDKNGRWRARLEALES